MHEYRVYYHALALVGTLREQKMMCVRAFTAADAITQVECILKPLMYREDGSRKDPFYLGAIRVLPVNPETMRGE